ncbi:hypothetical protein BKN51_20775 [Amycolatopsis sp. BJA-103]|nr:hypothetical protein BKN51_20775 [Amycolatopsis sp. BJA-103]
MASSPSTIAVNAVPDAAASNPASDTSPNHHPPTRSTIRNAAIAIRASADPRTPKARRACLPSMREPPRAGPAIVRLFGGSAPSATARSRSVPMSRGSTCSTVIASGVCPLANAHTTNGVSSATLSVRR